MNLKFTPPSKFYAIALLLLSYCNTFAQSEDFTCQFAADNVTSCDTEFSAEIDLEWLDNFDPVVVNIFFWELKDSNGNIQTGDYNPDWNFEKESLDVIAELNIYYNPYKIFFKYKGTGEIHNDELYEAANNFSTVLNGLVAGTSTPEDYKKPDAINAYVSPSLGGGAAPVFGRRYLIGRESYDIRLNVSTHEVGHNFGLLHTHAYWFNCYDPSDPDPLPNAFLAENVTRITTDDDYNADTNGDRVPDTAASPDLKFQYCEELGYDYPYYNGCNGSNYFEYINEEGCNYIDDDYYDCVGTLYNIPDDELRNIMSYAPNECKDIFTIGQGIRMREAIETSCTTGENGLQSAINPDGIASLYQPYKGEYYYAGPLPVDLEGNLNPPLYQPGFDYSFVSCDCDCPLPLDYGETGFTYNEQEGTFISKYDKHYNNITHPNHTAIDILILNELQPWRCYDNNNRKPNSGTIVKFNDNIFNTNVTITQQDSTSINDENLINNLDPGLYNIIEQYLEGDTEENVIIKENN